MNKGVAFLSTYSNAQNAPTNYTLHKNKPDAQGKTAIRVG